MPLLDWSNLYDNYDKDEWNKWYSRIAQSNPLEGNLVNKFGDILIPNNIKDVLLKLPNY